MLDAWLVVAGGVLALLAGARMAMLRRTVTRLSTQAEENARALTIERDTLAAVIDYAGDGLFTLDRDLRIRHFNPALSAMIGLPAEMVAGLPIEEVFGIGHAAAVVEALDRAQRARRAVRVETTLDTAAGRRELTIGYTAVPAGDGSVALAIGGVRDVTHEKEQARMREDFFSLVTHDLRNPLTAMVGTTYLLDQELARSFDETAMARRLVGRLEQANEKLSRLVDSLLEMQRVEVGRDLMQRRSIYARALVDELAEEFRGAASERVQTIRTAGPDVRLWGDPTWCRAIVANLLSNAVKYSPIGGAIEVVVASRGAYVTISVGDTGPGLLPEEQQQLFTRFFRSKRPELNAARGVGLGLALSKRMAERMSGDIVVASTPGEGSTFTVVLPLGELPPFIEQHDNAADGLRQRATAAARASDPALTV